MKTHHHLLAWQKARETALAVFRYSDRHWSPSRASAIEQVRRSALSVQLNIAEGFASGPGRRCRALLRVAYASAVETTDVLELLRDLGEDVEPLITSSREAQALTLRLWQRSHS